MAEAMSGDEQLADLGMVCDAYGLPHSAVALARHLAGNAELTIAVWQENCRRLEGQRNAAVAALRVAAGTPTHHTTEEDADE